MTPSPIRGRAEYWDKVLEHLEDERALPIGSVLIQGVRSGRARMSLAFSSPTQGGSAIWGVTDVSANAGTGVFAAFLSAKEAEELCARRVDSKTSAAEQVGRLPPLSTGTLSVSVAYAFADFLVAQPESPSVFMAVTVRNLHISYPDPLDGVGKARGELLAGWMDHTPLRRIYLSGEALFDAEYHVEGRAGEEPETLRCVELRLEASLQEPAPVI